MTRFVTVLLVVLCPVAFADHSLPSPGDLPGPHAFLGIHGPADDAAIIDKVIVEVFGDYTRDNFGGDTYALRYGVEVPFANAASIEIENLYETWSLPSDVAENLGIPDNGSNLGELAMSSKFLLIRERGRAPALSFKFAVKFPAGEDEEDRYTDTIGLLLSVLAAKNVYENPRASFNKIRLITELGLAVWDDNDRIQNDALKWGIATILQRGQPHRLRIGAYGIAGRRNNGDRPSVAHIEWEYKFSERTRMFAGAEAGLNEDADDYSLEVGARFRFNSVLPWSN